MYVTSYLLFVKGYIYLNFSMTHRLLKNGKTSTIVGSPNYMAPEMINNKGLIRWIFNFFRLLFVCSGFMEYWNMLL